MSVKYIPVQWNPNKWVYDAVLIVMMVIYLWVFLMLAPDRLDHERAINPQINAMRAFGSCAFLMLTVILCLGPLARLDRRFLPLVYNRRHFGVLTLIVALSHLAFVLDWYYAFSPTAPLEGLLSANTSFTRTLGFPFEMLGLFALVVLFVMAVTSHDFWLKFLTPRIWKRLHFLIYPAYAAVVGHVALGALQDQTNMVFAAVTLVSACLVGGLHLAAVILDKPAPAASGDWVSVAAVESFEDGRAKIVELGDGERAAVFRMGRDLAAISNACAHQNGPLGEGRIIDGCVTCPWHGFQYRLFDGRSPEPFTEKVPTYGLRMHNGMVELNRVANPPGTPTDPISLPEDVA